MTSPYSNQSSLLEMFPDGTPQVRYLRASRAVQTDTKPITEAPRPFPPRDGLLPRLLRGMLRHWFPLACGGMLMVGGYLGIVRLVLPIGANLLDQWHYGDARIVQLDADVGHGGVSHFLAQWYHGFLLLVEIPTDNPRALHAYRIEPLTANRGTLSLQVVDVNRDDRPDLLIQVAGDPAALVLYNTGTAFTESGV